MPEATLIAYATRSGSTGEVAEAIAAAMRETGESADVARMRAVATIRGYSRVVLGAPLYMGRLLKEFHQFVESNRRELLEVSVWCFVVGPVENKPEQFEEARRQALEQLKRHEWLKPEEVRVFGGLWDVRRMVFPFSVLRVLPAGKLPAMDVRDWQAIRRWGEEIAAQSHEAA